MNQGKSDIIAKRKVQALFRNKQKYKYDNHMQIPGGGTHIIGRSGCAALMGLFFTRNS